MNNETYLTTEELAQVMKYDACAIRERSIDTVLIEGVHYIRPFGGHKNLYLWKTIQKDMAKDPNSSLSIPMANGGIAHGSH